MKKFTISFLLFCGLLLIMNLLPAFLAHKYYFRPYFNESVSFDEEVYLLADSHGAALQSLNEINVTNLSFASDSYSDMKKKVVYLIEENKNLKKIIITVDNHSLSGYRDKRNNVDRAVLFSNYNNSKNKFDYIKYRYLYRFFIIPSSKAHSVVVQNILSKIKLKSSKNVVVLPKNIWSEKPAAEKKKLSLDRLKEQFPSRHKSKEQLKYLNEIILLCKDHNIELIGIKFPVSYELDKLLKKNNYGADCVFLSKKLQVLDYQSSLGNNDNYFHDQDHLNEAGKDKFINLLKKSTF